MNPKRTWKDIKEIRVFADKLKSGWVVEISYKDSKNATFSIDYGSKNENMLVLLNKCISRQMDSSKSWLI